MKKKKIKYCEYESPAVELMTVEMEKGFAASDIHADISPMPWG